MGVKKTEEEQRRLTTKENGTSWVSVFYVPGQKRRGYCVYAFALFPV